VGDCFWLWFCCRGGVFRIFAAGKATKGYAYHSDHSVPPQVSWKTYQGIIGLIGKHGKYLLDYFVFMRNNFPMQKPTSLEPIAVFRALAHPARVAIVKTLAAEEEKCVCHLVEVCGLGWSTVSRHLSILREAGVIADEKRGLQVFYRLRLPCVARFVDCLEHPRRYPDLHEATCCG